MTENFRPTVLRNQAYEALRGKWTPRRGYIARFLHSARRCRFFVTGQCTALSDRLSGRSIHRRNRHAIRLLGPLYERHTSRGRSTPSLRSNSNARTVGAVLLVFVYTLLWTLLLVIPGIIKAYSYSMTFYILRENPEMTAGDAIHRQPENDGRSQNGACSCMSLSFIGWLFSPRLRSASVTCG